jgi:pimeloyl-ACP methyl ester carboxylesterase
LPVATDWSTAGGDGDSGICAVASVEVVGKIGAMPIATNALADNSGVSINYETFGDLADPTLLLIGGHGVQLLSWPEALCESFVDRGFHVVRFDNRDVGFSTYFDDHDGDEPAYLLSDMAADAIAVLDDLDVGGAHVVGMSMGGMIAQTVAIEHPDRVRSLTSIASNTGEEGFGAPTPEALEALLSAAPQTREAVIESDLEGRKIWASEAYWDEEASRAQLAAFYDRAHHPEGSSRHTEAILASGSRDNGLAALDIAALVIHADADALVNEDGGARTAELIPDATLLTITDMGHELPVQAWSQIVEAITALAASTMST